MVERDALERSRARSQASEVDCGLQSVFFFFVQTGLAGDYGPLGTVHVSLLEYILSHITGPLVAKFALLFWG